VRLNKGEGIMNINVSKKELNQIVNALIFSGSSDVSVNHDLKEEESLVDLAIKLMTENNIKTADGVTLNFEDLKEAERYAENKKVVKKIAPFVKRTIGAYANDKDE